MLLIYYNSCVIAVEIIIKMLIYVILLESPFLPNAEPMQATTSEREQTYQRIPTIEEVCTTSRTNTCTFCGKCFKYEYALKTHEKFLCKLKLD